VGAARGARRCFPPSLGGRAAPWPAPGPEGRCHRKVCEAPAAVDGLAAALAGHVAASSRDIAACVRASGHLLDVMIDGWN
jgi:hypothetical protein